MSDVVIQESSQRAGCWELTSSVWVPVERPAAFAFFADAQNLEELTPPWLRFRVLTPQPITMRTGARIDYRLKLHGMPIGWKTEISAWDPPTGFVDTQISGPYRFWIHAHTFEDCDRGTRVGDRVTYSMLCGKLAHRLFVRNDLQRIFEFRRQRLLELLGNAEADLEAAG